MVKKIFILPVILNAFIFANSGILNVGFDIDDTILFSKDVFQSIPDDKRDPIDYGWVNEQDAKLSIYIDPTVELINYFVYNGHNLFFITARSGENGESLARFLSSGLHLDVKVNDNLFFCPNETINGIKYTTKDRKMVSLKLDLF